MLKQILKVALPKPVRKRLRARMEAILARPDWSMDSLTVLNAAHRRVGIMNYETMEVSGESFLLKRILPVLLNSPSPTLFDVGANEGGYTLALLGALPGSTVRSFEPMPETYSRLKNKVPGGRTVCVPKGVSNTSGTATFFDYSDGQSSEHASLFQDVFTVLHKPEKVKSINVELITLDEYCQAESVKKIDFIKIDTEGNELAVLQGAAKTIASGGLPLIQFEFNEMNVVSRSFLKDFYQVLEGYAFFRLMPNGLLPLGPYNPRNEIFAFQNIIAVRTESYPDAAVASFIVPVLEKPPVIDGLKGS